MGNKKKSTDKASKPKSGLFVVMMRNEFYRDNFYTIRFAIILLILLNSVLGLVIFFKAIKPPPPKFFSTTADGRLIKLHPLYSPQDISDNLVIQWASDAVREAFSLDYIHWRKQLQTASKHFTSDGWKWFLDSLKQSNNLKTLRELKMVSNVSLTGSPRIARKAVVSNTYVWEVKMPLLLEYVSANPTVSKINMPWMVTLVVVRMPRSYYPQGIAINNFLVGVR